MSRRTSNDSSKSGSSLAGSVGRKAKPAKYEVNGEFNWDKYLQQTGMKAAPLECFKQRSDVIPLVNKFQKSQKLETTDARNPSAISVATIVDMQGPRLRLSLDGTDGCNDFWRLCDSKDIFPLGTCSAHGGLLQPPLGFKKNVSNWPSFLQRTLQGADQVDSSCFLQEPDGPGSNIFEIGMKIEATDRKNPQLICPATVGNVERDQIFISFDGWRGAFDYWVPFDSRDIYPVGWCSINNHALQPPGVKGENPIVTDKLRHLAEKSKRQTRSVTNQLEPKPTIQKETAAPSGPTKPLRRRREKVLQQEIAADKPEKSTKIENDTNAAGTSDSSNSSDESDSSNDDTAGKNKRNTKEEQPEDAEADAQTDDIPDLKDDTLNQISLHKIRRLERRARRKHRKHLAKVLRRAGLEGEFPDVKQLSIKQIALLASPRKRKSGDNEILLSKLLKKKKRRKTSESYTRMEGFGLKPESGMSKSPITPTSPSFMDMVGPTPTSLFGVGKSPILRGPTQGWPTRIGSVVTSDNKLGRFDKNVPSNENPTESERTRPHVSTTTNPPTTPRPFTPPSVSSTTADEINAVSSTTNPPSRSATPVDPKIEVMTPATPNKSVSTTSDNPSPKIMQNKPTPTTSDNPMNPNNPSTLNKHRSRNPTKWTVDDVVSYVNEREPALQGQLNLFHKHEIDGSALLLLNSSNVVKYMSLKLGPALKLCNLVEELKEKVARHCKRRKNV